MVAHPAAEVDRRHIEPLVRRGDVQEAVVGEAPDRPRVAARAAVQPVERSSSAAVDDVRDAVPRREALVVVVMNSRHTRRLTIALGLVLTIAALVAPSANAKMQRIYSDRGVVLVPVSSEPNPNMVYSDRGVAPITPESKPTGIPTPIQTATPAPMR